MPTVPEQQINPKLFTKSFALIFIHNATFVENEIFLNKLLSSTGDKFITGAVNRGYVERPQGVCVSGQVWSCLTGAGLGQDKGSSTPLWAEQGPSS